MARIKYDVSEVEPSGDQDFDTPVPKGLYLAKISEMEETESSNGNEMIALTLEIIQGEYKGRLLWDYIVLTDAAAWKLRQFVDAVGLKGKGMIDTNTLTGTKLQVRVKHETSAEYGTRAKVGALLAVPEDEDAADVAADAEEEEPAEAGDYSVEDLEEMDREDLEEVIDSEELDVKFNKRTSDEVLLQRVAEALGVELDEDDDEEDEDEVEDYSDLSVSELRAECKERGIKHTGSKPTLVKRLEADDEEDDDDGEPF